MSPWEGLGSPRAPDFAAVAALRAASVAGEAAYRRQKSRRARRRRREGSGLLALQAAQLSASSRKLSTPCRIDGQPELAAKRGGRIVGYGLAIKRKNRRVSGSISSR
jgi:hypothetical protein